MKSISKLKYRYRVLAGLAISAAVIFSAFKYDEYRNQQTVEAEIKGIALAQAKAQSRELLNDMRSVAEVKGCALQWRVNAQKYEYEGDHVTSTIVMTNMRDNIVVTKFRTDIELVEDKVNTTTRWLDGERTGRYIYQLVEDHAKLCGGIK